MRPRSRRIRPSKKHAKSREVYRMGPFPSRNQLPGLRQGFDRDPRDRRNNLYSSPVRGRAMPLLQLVLVVLYTILLGSLGIVLCILVPGGSALLPLARLWSFLILKT